MSVGRLIDQTMILIFYGYLYCWFIAVASAAAVLCFVPKDSVR